jgi:hypothetical protein
MFSSDDFSWSNHNGNDVQIDTYDPSGLDHSMHKFIVGHELGHAQGYLTGMPIPSSSDYDDVTSGVQKCNCSHISSSTEMCFQSLEAMRPAQGEAWAYFYGAALLNARQTNCGMGYFREMYTGSTPQSATLETTVPVTVDCADMPKWRAELCPAEDNGVLQDWLGFYWNVWTNGTYKYTVDEITDVYSRPEVSFGYHWDELKAAAQALYGIGTDKTGQFTETGEVAGVDNLDN